MLNINFLFNRYSFLLYFSIQGIVLVFFALYFFKFLKTFLRLSTLVSFEPQQVITFSNFCQHFSQVQMNIPYYNENRFGPSAKDKRPHLE